VAFPRDVLGSSEGEIRTQMPMGNSILALFAYVELNGSKKMQMIDDCH
jgi:hypothetical protein